MSDSLNGWKDVVMKLAERVKAPILAFGVIVVVVIALIGQFVPEGFYRLVYMVVAGVMGIYVLTLYLKRQQPKGTTTTPEDKEDAQVPTDADPKTAYLSTVIADCRRARLVGLDPKAADPGRGGLSLDRLYVSLDTTAQAEPEEGAKKRREASVRAELEQDRRPLSALEAVGKEPCMALLGLPGAGKSTFLRYLTLRMAQALCDPDLDVQDLLPGWRGGPLLPIIVPLGALSASLPPDATSGNANMIDGFLAGSLDGNESTKGFGPRLLEALKSEGGLVLFDGLDEVANLELRPVVVEAIEAFAQHYGGRQRSRFVVTCRTFSYTDERWQLTGWPTYQIAALSRQKIEEFIHAWHNAHIDKDPAQKADYEAKRGKMLTALAEGERRRLAEVADNPLVLTVMAVVHTHEGELPDTRAQVYEKCVDILLIRWESQRSTRLGGESSAQALLDALGLSSDIPLKRSLWEIAYRAQEGRRDNDSREQAALVTEDLLAGVLHAELGDPGKVETFLGYCRDARGLLMLQGVAPLPDAAPNARPRKVYAFPHLTFQEYLAGRYLVNLKPLGAMVRDHICRSDRWREVVMFLAEHVLFRDGDHERMDAVLDALVPDPLPRSMQDEDWRCAWMAGDLLMLYRRARPGKPNADERITRTLCRLVQRGALSCRERAAAADVLGRLGDPRFRQDRWYLPDEDLLGFVEIPEGPFLMGSDPQTAKSAYEHEQPQHELSLPTFYLARYPVTVAQFRAFVEDSGHQPAGEESHEGLLNHPVVNVSWRAAMEYCEWLAEKLRTHDDTPEPLGTLLRDGSGDGKPWRIVLPSEAEWEKAARGADGRVYPWGNDFDLEKANVEMNVGHTTPVGCFPKGDSPLNCSDMAGNVWEWTRSLWGEDVDKPAFPYPYDSRDGREDVTSGDKVLRVLRGGSFYYTGRCSRCAYRYRLSPHFRYYDIGFRLCVCPHF